ncbi:hypothetical protein FisN_1Lh717 [Fistulifera solaris]|uniref:Protein kinase domain-containing protein n=1 Tax=Fistulifera solaris TaxID=1519565 RepID=A0A1Z5KJS7_FISSO|nr:hypothetical protein FisN_1Lh717 [Fistulifera solaris]|eukprot:GAX26457.1 hypothetical protein FisN_1Lh717 [Fistulifera solaris]
MPEESSSLPFASYHRASQVGAGSFGSVLTVYNDEGEQFALKLFFKGDNDNDDDDDESAVPLELGTLREISCLRFLRGRTEESHHPHIIRLVDIQPEWSEEEGGAGTSGCLGMAMPWFPCSLAKAIEQKRFQSDKRVKVQIAHDLLAAVEFLHKNGIMHRDIKSDNILLQQDENSWRAVLTDFSLAKVFVDKKDNYAGHTGEVGTLVYSAPEILNDEEYDASVDLWSVGVVLIELLKQETTPGLKAKQIVPHIQTILKGLSDQPFPDLIRSLLKVDPAERLSANEALQHELFSKFQLDVPNSSILNVKDVLPYEYTSDLSKNAREKRLALIKKACAYLESESPLTAKAAFEYSTQLDQLDDNVNESQSLLDCVVLAHRFFEVEHPDLDALDEEDKGIFAEWSLSEYVENESTLFMLLDYCLYPRFYE